MSTKVITGKVRLSYVNIFTPKRFNDGGVDKYSCSVLIPKTDTKTMAKIKDAINAEIQDGIASKWGGKKPANLHLPVRDGDAERPDDEAYKGMWFFNATSKNKPGIVDAQRQAILDPEEIYSGCWGRVSVNFYPYNNNGNRGVAVGLNNVQKLSDGERLGGSYTPAEEDFDDGYTDPGASADPDNGDLPF